MMLVSAVLLILTVTASFRETVPVASGVYEQLAAAVLLIVGFIVTAIIDRISRKQSGPPVQKIARPLAFNPTLIHEIIHLHLELPNYGPTNVRSAEVTSADLVGRDNALALAKLRLDLGQALRGLALNAGIEPVGSSVGVSKLAELLAVREILPVELMEPIRQIVTVCNQAIHGYEVSDELANSLVSVGTDLVTHLRSMAESRDTSVEAAATAET
jgi:hypothetical protein